MTARYERRRRERERNRYSRIRARSAGSRGIKAGAQERKTTTDDARTLTYYSVLRLVMTPAPRRSAARRFLPSLSVDSRPFHALPTSAPLRPTPRDVACERVTPTRDNHFISTRVSTILFLFFSIPALRLLPKVLKRKRFFSRSRLTKFLEFVSLEILFYGVGFFFFMELLPFLSQIVEYATIFFYLPFHKEIFTK